MNFEYDFQLLLHSFKESISLFIGFIFVSLLVMYLIDKYIINPGDYEIISIEEYNKTNLDMHEVEYFEMDQEEHHNYNLEDGYMAFM